MVTLAGMTVVMHVVMAIQAEPAVSIAVFGWNRPCILVQSCRSVSEGRAFFDLGAVIICV